MFRLGLRTNLKSICSCHVSTRGTTLLRPRTCDISKFSTSAKFSQDRSEEPLWVRSKLPNIRSVEGFTFPEVCREQVGSWGHLVAFECGITGRKYTHDQVYSLSRSFAAALIRAGFKRGDVVAVVLPNIPEYAIVIFGIWDAGLIASPVNPAYTADEMKRQLESSEAKAVVTISNFVPAIVAVKEKSPILKSVIVVGKATEGCHTFAEMIRTDVTGVEFCKGSQIDTVNDTCLLPYSSGTAGLPKGVMLTHSNLASNALQFCAGNHDRTVTPGENQEQERFIGILPFFHSYGFMAIMNFNLFRGCHTVTLPTFDVQTYMSAVRKHKPTYLHVVTPIISLLVNHTEFRREDLEAVHTFLCAAAPAGASIIHQMLHKFGEHILYMEAYGLTEMSPCTHLLLPWTKNAKIGSCGQPVASTLTKIVDLESGKALPRGQSGEVCVKGPQAMKGYYKNEEATRNTIDPDGWLHTGDIGYYDEDDCLYIVDRLKELIKVKGFQVAPSELENLLRNHPNVEDVAVIGIPDNEWGEAPRAYIVKKKNTDLEENDVQDFIKNQVTSYKQLRGGVEFLEAIPKAPSGKILRRELMSEYKSKISAQ